MVEKTVLEVIAPTVDDAIQQGLDQLALPRNAVEIEILDAGSRGIFGIGNRQARVRLIVISQAQSEEEEEPEEESFPEAYEEMDIASEAEVQEFVEKRKDAPPPFEVENALDVTRNVVDELLERMKVNANIVARYVPPVDKTGKALIYVDIQGNDLSILIGRRSETLNALQYISSLIVSKELGHWIPLLVDVQGYRARREQQLRKLARRLAEQAVISGRRQVLEPMPADERRYIHLELRNNAQVITESIGEEPNRKVTILLKKPS